MHNTEFILSIPLAEVKNSEEVVALVSFGVCSSRPMVKIQQTFQNKTGNNMFICVLMSIIFTLVLHSSLCSCICVKFMHIKLNISEIKQNFALDQRHNKLQRFRRQTLCFTCLWLLDVQLCKNQQALIKLSLGFGKADKSGFNFEQLFVNSHIHIFRVV